MPAEPASAPFAELALGPTLQAVRAVRAFAEATALRPTPTEPTWETEGRTAWAHPLCTLREIGPSDHAGAGAPFLLVAPEVNAATIADYGPDQSLLVAARDARFPRVLVLVWRSATQATKDATLGDSIRAIEAALAAVGEPVHLAGICQGGWAAAIVASRQAARVRTLTLVASAIAFKAGDAVLSDLVDAVPQRIYEAMVRYGGGVARGDLLNAGFDALQAWERFAVGPLRAWTRLHDPRHRAREALLHRWYGLGKDLPGPMYLTVVDALFRKDLLRQGRLVLDGEEEAVDLRRIVAPLALVAGSRDHITPPEQVFALQGLAGSKVVRRELLDQGHVGVSIGADALRERWPGIFAWLRSFDVPADQPSGTEPPVSTPALSPPRNPRRRRGRGVL